MKTEFLQNFKVGDQPLPKEVIDAILAENGRDIEALKTDRDNLKTQLQTAKDGLKAFEGVDVKDLQSQITKLQQDLADKDTAHQAELANMAFDRKIEDAITGAKGKNAKAIKALLDVEKLKASKNQDADLKAAMEALQKDSGYLFGDVETPPGYSAGTGTGGGVGGSVDGVTAAFTKLNPGLKI